MNMNPTKVITGPNTRMSYANVWEPKGINGSEPKYSVSLIIPKSDKETINKIKKAIQAAYKEGASKLRGKGNVLPTLDQIHNPLRDGDVDKADDEAYKNAMFVNAKNSTRPGIVDVNLNRIIDPSEFYSGCYGRASITFYAYNRNGNRGIACSLNNLQKVADGEPLGGKSRAEDDFADGFTPDDDFLA